MNHHFGQFPAIDLKSLALRFERDMGWTNFLAGKGGKSIFAFLINSARRCKVSDIVLDISAGQCRYKPFFDHCQYVALDSMVGEPDWDFSHLDLIGDALNLPIKSDILDGCLNFTSLEHYPDPFKAFSEFYRVLKPGGQLFLYVPFIQDEHQVPYDFFRYTRYGIAHLCHKSGFKIEFLRPTSGVFETTLAWAKIATNYLSGAEKQQLIQAIEQHLQPAFQVAEQHPAVTVDYPTKPLFPQMPGAYCLRARKPGAKSSPNLLPSKQALLEHITDCPNCKQRSIRWNSNGSIPDWN